MKNHKNEIILVPQGGLANRMRALASGLFLAQKLSRPLNVIWVRNFELNAPFDSIFQTNNLPFKIINPSDSEYFFRYQSPRKKNFYLSKFLSFLSGKKIIDINKEISETSLYEMIDQHDGDFIINSGLQFANFENEFLRSIFSFSEPVLTVQKELLKNYNPKFSVQIRRTDNKSSIENSPLFLFEKIINDHLNEDSGVKFFLATDDDGIKKHLSHKYPHNIIYNPNPANRQTRQGMIDAAAEFKIMSECETIYGSYWSSFAEIAAAYGNKKLIVAKK